MNDKPTDHSDFHRPLVVVVGPCASGKSTLANHLRAHGVNVHVVGQEHSAVKWLWRRRDPDYVIALDVDLPTLRRRRSEHWPESVYVKQRERLEDAFAAASIIIDTSHASEWDVLRMVLDLPGIGATSEESPGR